MSNSKVVKVFRFLLVILVPVLVLFNSSCKKDQYSTAPLAFSNDTLTFDTVFTTLGSTTKYFKVFNHSKSPVKIDNIQLQHLVGTQFRINVDGVPGEQFSGVEIPGKDSIYVFVEVTVNPNNLATPFVIIDNISFTISGKTQNVFLQAFGQNAHFHYGEEIKPGETKTWANDLPHVIIPKDSVPGVLIDCGATLNINPGVKVFFSGNSAIFVEGTLNAKAGSWSDSIVFRGARLEDYYTDLPGQWFGIVFLRNNGCTPTGHLDHCVVNESNYGVYVGAGLSNYLPDYQNQTQSPVVTLDNCIVKNSQYNSVYGFNATVNANNCLFYAAGENVVKLGLGGNYTFNNCTIYNTGTHGIDHQKPALLVSNFVSDGTNAFPAPLNTVFNNCLIYGSLTNEISFNNIDNLSTSNFSNAFNYCALQTPADTLALFSTVNNQNIFNQDPKLKNPNEDDFTPSDSLGYFSPLIDYSPSGLSRDIYGHLRPVSKTSNSNKFDIGAVEAQ